MVGFGPCRKMGEEASIAVGSNFRNTVTGAMKRLVGLEFNNPVAKEEMERYKGLLTFCPVPHAGENKADSIGVQVEFNETTTVLPIEQVAGMMITHMGQIVAAKVAQGTPNAGNTDASELTLPQDWVIAIPTYWTDAQRRSLLTGCEIVGITGVQRLMHENTATALAYGIFKDLRKEFSAEKPTQVMFIDMGASAYTVSIAVFHPGKLHVLTSHCDSRLGGRDFDLLIAEWIANKFEEKYKSKLSSGKPMDVPKTRIKLLAAAEKAKKTLSPKGVTEARLNLEMLQDDLDFSITLKAEEYEELCKPLLARLNKPIQACLDEAKISNIADGIDKVEVVGGSTRIGCVTRHIKAAFGIETLYTTMNADEAVARGAALQSAILSPRFKVLPYDIEEAQPYPIQIAWTPTFLAAAAAETEGAGAGSGEPAANSVVMFDRGLSFPIVRRVTLKRQGDFQVEALYDDSATQYELDARENKSIASFHIKAAPGNTSGEKKVRVNVKQDIHGIIHLSSAQMVEEIEEESKDPPAADGAAAAAAADESKKEGGDGAEVAEKKKKVKKTNLDFTVSRPLEWTRDEIFRANEIEVSMANTDRVVRETSNMRNELESYIYDMRDKVASDSHLGLYGTDSEKSAFASLSEQTENWLYEEGFNATKSTYAEKLDSLRKMGQPMEVRQVQASGRAAAVSALQANLDIYKKWVNESQTLSNYAHITDEERLTVDKKCDEISGWMYEMLDRQGNCAPHEDAVLTVQDLDSKNRSLTETCGTIMKKPIPPPAPAPKEDEAKEDEAAAASSDGAKEDPPASSGGEPMEVDGQTNGGSTTPAADMEVDT
jgi:heat shock 70kDa protein 4